jgi:hypothetical protein
MKKSRNFPKLTLVRKTKDGEGKALPIRLKLPSHDNW